MCRFDKEQGNSFQNTASHLSVSVVDLVGQISDFQLINVPGSIICFGLSYFWGLLSPQLGVKAAGLVSRPSVG